MSWWVYESSWKFMHENVNKIFWYTPNERVAASNPGWGSVLPRRLIRSFPACRILFVIYSWTFKTSSSCMNHLYLLPIGNTPKSSWVKLLYTFASGLPSRIPTFDRGSCGVITLPACLSTTTNRDTIETLFTSYTSGKSYRDSTFCTPTYIKYLCRAVSWVQFRI